VNAVNTVNAVRANRRELREHCMNELAGRRTDYLGPRPSR
jgi:hypothetical protein